MIDTAALLTALQFGDGQFPGGGFAFSWGLESLIADGAVSRPQFAAFLAGQLRQRWAPFDRILTGHAHAAAASLPTLYALDELADALLTVEGARAGSRRAGGALLGTHARLGTTGAADLKAGIAAGLAVGHLPIVQGVVLAGVGLDAPAVLAVSAYTAAQTLCTAAIRLGLIGHLEAQRALSAVLPVIAPLVREPLPALEDMSGFVPVTDIAMMRHALRPLRLFSN